MQLVKPKEQDPMKCPACNGPIMALRSQYKKICYDCGSQFNWELKPGQQPLIKHTR